MSSPLNDTIDHVSPLDQVIAGYLEAVEEGRPPNRPHILAQHPELAGELQGFFDNRDLMKRWAGKTRFIIPTYLGDYQVLEEIGSGAFGVVVKARNRKAPEIVVAIKLFRGKRGSSHAEARKAALLDHPNIVKVIDVGEHDGRAYYVMHYIAGQNLAQRLKTAKEQPPEVPASWLARLGGLLTGRPTAEERRQRWAAELVAKIARAVHHAHQRGVTHRDLKPANILTDRVGEPHVTDFDLAKLAQEDRWHFEVGPAEESGGVWGSMALEDGPVAETVVSEKGLIIGTATYMSPEQAAPPKEVTTASDLYSLGVILYEMLTGQVPIRGKTSEATLQLIQTVTSPPPRSLNPRVDRRLEMICLKCLNKDPLKRYGSAAGLANDLERWLKDEPLAGIPTGLAERCRLWGRRYPALAGLTLAAIVLLAVVTTAAMSIARDRAARVQEEVLKGNVYSAQGVASTALWHFERLSDPVLKIQSSPELQRLMQERNQLRREAQALHPNIDPKTQDPLAENPNLADHLEARARKNVEGLRQLLKQLHRDYADPAKGLVQPGEDLPFQEWYFLDNQGWLLAISSHDYARPPRYHWRDYFAGAMARRGKSGRESVHVSMVFEGTMSKVFKFAISAPVYSDGEPKAEPLGVIAMTIPMRPTWGKIDLNDHRRTAVLVGPLENGPPPQRGPRDFVVVLHPAYTLGDKAIKVGSDKPQLLHRPHSGSVFQLPGAGFDPSQATDANYADPFGSDDRHAGQYAGRWLAGFAPVGNTGYMVIVQQRYDEAIGQDTGIFWSAVAVFIGILFILAIARLGFQWVGRPRE